MKKFKKLIALTCVAAMLVPTIAFAEEPGTATSGTMSGDGVIENDNAPSLDVTNVVLPTTALASDTYNFTIDAAELLATVDGENYDANDAKGVWFKAESTPAQLTIVPADGGTPTYDLYEKVYKVDTDFSTIEADLATQTSVPALDTEKYAVWVPELDASSVPTGNGKYEFLTADTIVNYFDIKFEGAGDVFSAITPKQNTTGNYIFDGELYVVGYDAIDGDDAAAKYYSEPEGTPTLAAGLFVESSDAAGTYNAATLGTTAGKLKFEAAEFQNQGTSSKATVINKSTFDIKVSAKVTVTNAAGLTFEATEAALTTKADDASIYMAVSADDGTTTPVSVTNSVASATVSVKIDGVDTANSTLYQTAGPEAITGSHQYYRYLDPISSYEDAYFEITAAVDATDNWDAYLAAVKKAGAAPDIEVVYSWEKLGAEITGSTYNTAGSNTYTIAWNSVATANRTIKSITGGTSEANASQVPFETASYTLSGTTLTIDGTKGAFGAAAVGQKRYLKVTFGDDSYVVFEVTCS